MAQPKKTAAAASEKPMIDQIIAGAERAFLDAGYELTTMDSVARHAGVARGSVYNHFSSKEELFLAVMRRGTAEFVERSLRHDAESKPPVERLRSVAVHFLRAATDSVSVEMYRTVVTQAERLPELSALFYSQGLQPIEMKFRGILTLMASDLNEEPALAADHLLSLLMGGFFSRRLLRAPRHPADKSLETYVDRAIASLLKRA
jgi:TetR/AcrR family transcriptional repressor of mexJK operon